MQSQPPNSVFDIVSALLGGVGGAIVLKIIDYLIKIRELKHSAQTQSRQTQTQAEIEAHRMRVDAELKREESFRDDANALRQELRVAERELRQELQKALQTILEQGARINHIEAQNNNFAQRVTVLSLERDNYMKELEQERNARERLEEELDAARERIAELERVLTEMRHT